MSISDSFPTPLTNLPLTSPVTVDAVGNANYAFQAVSDCL